MFADTWLDKACTYSLIGDKENALKNLSKAIDLEGENVNDNGFRGKHLITIY
jgi:hypothetical protein